MPAKRLLHEKRMPQFKYSSFFLQHLVVI